MKYSFVLVMAIIFVGCVAVLSQAQRCGRDFGGRTCPENQCCSHWGWCGTTADHCSETRGCQSGCRCGGNFGGATCSPGRCCSVWSWCGTSNLHCCYPYCQSGDCRSCPSGAEPLDLAAVNTTGTAQPLTDASGM